jgi:hypothetical protein
MPFHQVVMGSTKGPEWPSPHDCTSSVLDELVLIQLLNLVQSQRLNHTPFFWGPPSRDFFFHLRTSPAHPTTLFQKKFPTTLLLYLCYRLFFSKLSFFSLSLSMLQLSNHPLSSLMFREELGIATTSRCEQHEVQCFQEDTKTKFVFYTFFCTCGFSTFSIWI